MSSKERGPVCRQAGQSLIELIVVISVVAMVVGSLVFATIASLRNAQFSKNQSLATKLAQEGIEKVRSIRDRNGPADYIKSDGSHTSTFNDLWPISFDCSGGNCYFYFNSTGVLFGGNASKFEDVPPNFKRQIQIEGSATDSKKITVVVNWIDTSGSHESRLTTILGKL